MRRKTLSRTIIEFPLFSDADAEKSIIESCHVPPTVIKAKNASPCTVVCDPDYMHQLLHYLDWGRITPRNYLEDIFEISGHIFYHGDSITIIPRMVIRMVSTQRSKTHVVTTSESKIGAIYQNSISELNIEHCDCPWLSEYGSLSLVGHGHTHPDLGGIGVCPSGIDREEHAMHESPWISQICDPIRLLSAFYYGAQMQPANVTYILYPEDAVLFNSGCVQKRKKPLTMPAFCQEVYTPCSDESNDAIDIKDTQSPSRNTNKNKQRGKKKRKQKKQRKMKEKVSCN